MRSQYLARFIGGRDNYFTNGKTYPIGVRTRLFSRKIRVYKRRGYFEAADEGSIRDYANKTEFHQNWELIREDYQQ